VNLERKDLEKLARLARLSLSEQQAQAVLPSLNSVLDWVGELSEAPTEGIEPMAHPHALSLRLRDDQAQTLPDRRLLMQNAPEQSGGLFLVPRVVE
jgi:aspartyl-tRNA(Asn)/glutamyl-tRNA(Gln) amidotransferase subunit C